MVELKTTQWLEYMKTIAEREGVSLDELVKQAYEDAAELIFETEGFKKWEKDFLSKKENENNS